MSMIPNIADILLFSFKCITTETDSITCPIHNSLSICELTNTTDQHGIYSQDRIFYVF